jgi:hypothetical protein
MMNCSDDDPSVEVNEPESPEEKQARIIRRVIDVVDELAPDVFALLLTRKKQADRKTLPLDSVLVSAEHLQIVMRQARGTWLVVAECLDLNADHVVSFTLLKHLIEQGSKNTETSTQ